MTSQRSTGFSETLPAGIQPVRPFGRPGIVIRYHDGLPVFASSSSESASTDRAR